MAGLVPAIHVFTRGKDVDARHKAGHDRWFSVTGIGFLSQRPAHPRSTSAIASVNTWAPSTMSSSLVFSVQ
jgi:hypothetical protein